MSADSQIGFFNLAPLTFLTFSVSGKTHFVQIKLNDQLVVIKRSPVATQDCLDSLIGSGRFESDPVCG